MPIGPTLEVQEDLQIIFSGVGDEIKVPDGDKGDITVSSAGNTWTVNKNAILNKTTESAVGADYILISDTSDSGNVKKALVSTLPGGGGGGGSVAWGGIIGTLSDQTDLQTALDGKVSDTGDTMTGALTITGAGLTVDSADNTLVVDATNNRVGIGTATPAQALDVVGQVASSSFFRTNSGLTNNSSGNNSTIRPQTGGTLIDRNVADGNPVLRIQNLNAGSTGDVLRLQDSSTNNLVSVDVSGQMTINGRSSSRTLNIVPQVNQSSSNTTGGALRVDNTLSNGLGTLIYTNGGAGQTGRLLDINVANSAYDRAGAHMDYAGVANAFEISNTGTGTSNIALNVVSTNSGDSAVGIAGSESSRGTVKITHNKPTGSDAGSSALSLRANGAGTAAHAIFFDAEQTGGTTGDLMLMRQNGVNTWRVDNTGTLQVGTIPTARVQNLSGTNTGDQNTFSTIAVSGQSNVVADSTSDTLTLVAGSHITLTTNAANDEITIASTGGGGGGGYTDEEAQDAVGTILTDTTSIDLIYDDAGNTISAQREALTGAITASKNSNTTALGTFTVSDLNTAISDGDVATGGGTATGTNTGDQTFITPRVQTVASSATVTPTASDDLVVITAQAAGLTLANPTGTFVQGQSMVIRIKDNGTARSIAYGADYRAIGVTLPTTTVINKTTYLGCIYNTTDSKLDIVGVCTEA